MKAGGATPPRAGARRRTTRIDFAALRAQAQAVLPHAHAPYSQLQVAAAVIDARGRVFTGVNVENASYGLTVCAERNALAAAVCAGAAELVALVLVSSADHRITPCGACRQVLLELAPDAALRCYGPSGAPLVTSTRALMPHAFAAHDVAGRPATSRRPRAARPKP